MKKMKKFVSVLLTVALVLGMSIPAFAATVSNGTTGHSYEAYQIFTGTQAEGSSELGDIAWGSGVDSAALVEKMANSKYFKECTTATDVATVLAGKADGSNEAKEFAKLAADCLTATATPIAKDATAVELAPGYYLLVDVTEGLDGIEDDAHNSALLQVTGKGDIQITKKYTIPEVNKEIIDGAAVVVNEASIGEDVKYQITGTLPDNLGDYDHYYYSFNDTLSKGLTYNGDMEVYVVNEGAEPVDVTDSFTIDAGEYSAENGTYITATITDLLSLNSAENTLITKDSKIVVEYSAKVNTNAVIGGDGNPNKVVLEFSNDPNHDGDGTTTPPDLPTGITPESIVITYVTEVRIHKVDGDNKPLQGAEFTLTGENCVKTVIVTKDVFEESTEGTFYKLKDGTYTETAPTEETADAYASVDTKYALNTVVEVKDTNQEGVTVSGTVGVDGVLTFTGLGAGEYKIEETGVPAGYNKAADIEFTITFDPATKTFSSDNSKVVAGGDNAFDVTIVNEKGLALPETGGIGTTIFYIVGAILLIGSAVALITKKRMNR